MSLYHLPRPWNPGFAIPAYVQAEPPERGTFVTAQLPRGTISQVIPNYLAVPGPRGAPADALGAFNLSLSNPLVLAAAAIGGVLVLRRVLKKGRR